MADDNICRGVADYIKGYYRHSRQIVHCKHKGIAYHTKLAVKTEPHHKVAIVKIVNKGDLSYDEAYAVMKEIMSVENSPTLKFIKKCV